MRRLWIFRWRNQGILLTLCNSISLFGWYGGWRRGLMELDMSGGNEED